MAAAIPTLYDGFKNAAAVTPNDANDLTYQARALYVGGAGALAVQINYGPTVTIAAVPAGTTIQGLFTRVLATGTVATSIVAFW